MSNPMMMMMMMMMMIGDDASERSLASASFCVVEYILREADDASVLVAVDWDALWEEQRGALQEGARGIERARRMEGGTGEG
eukprot:2604789-Rhodomonas_salina.1